MKIVVRTPNWLGDCIMALPVFRELRCKYPNAEIVAACRKNVAECFSASKYIDRVILAPSKGANISEYIKSIRELRNEHFDIGILNTNSFGTALWLALGGVKRRIGFARDYRRFLLTDHVMANAKILTAHQGEYYLDVLKVLGIKAEMGYPELEISSKGRAEAENSLKELNLLNKAYAVIAPLSAYGGVKDWGNSKYAEVAKQIVQTLGMEVVITGTPEQVKVTQEISNVSVGVHNLAGKVSLSGFMGIIEKAALYIGGDSGGAHTAAALSVPTVTIFGITEPSRTKAIGRKVTVVGDGGMCTPNLRDPEVQKAARKALEAITPEKIINEARLLLEKEK